MAEKKMFSATGNQMVADAFRQVNPDVMAAYPITPQTTIVEGYAKFVADGKVTVGVRPEGFVPDEKGGLCCKLLNVEVMGRDVSVVSTHPAFQGAAIRAIVASDAAVSREAETVRFRLKPNKVLLFDPETELRIPFEV